MKAYIFHREDGQFVLIDHEGFHLAPVRKFIATCRDDVKYYPSKLDVSEVNSLSLVLKPLETVVKGKMTKDNATPRPWEVSDLDKCRIVADDNAGRYVAITHHDMLHNTEMNEANARLIVRAVNSHDELVSTLKNILMWIEETIDDYEHDDPLKKAIADHHKNRIDMIKDVLRKVGE